MTVKNRCFYFVKSGFFVLIKGFVEIVRNTKCIIRNLHLERRLEKCCL